MMNKSMIDKEELNLKLTDIYDQLEALEGIIEAAFTKNRFQLNSEKLLRISKAKQQLSAIEKKFIDYNSSGREEIETYPAKRVLNLELGF